MSVHIRGILGLQARPESKKWLDPAIIERNFQEREAAQTAEEVRRIAAVAAARADFTSALTRQVAEKAARKADQAAATRAELEAINAALEVFMLRLATKASLPFDVS